MSSHLMLSDELRKEGSGFPRTALELLSALTQEQHDRLLAFARRRLDRLALRPHLRRLLTGITPEDLVHTAIERILLGDIHSSKGRRLRPEHRRSTDAFMQGTMSVINSQVSNLVTSAEASFPHVQLGENSAKVGGLELIEPNDLNGLLQRRDLQRALFERLRRLAAPELRQIIDHWEPRFLEEDCIAHRQFDRRLVYRVRVLARSIVSALDGTSSGATAGTGSVR